MALVRSNGFTAEKRLQLSQDVDCNMSLLPCAKTDEVNQDNLGPRKSRLDTKRKKDSVTKTFFVSILIVDDHC